MMGVRSGRCLRPARRCMAGLKYESLAGGPSCLEAITSATVSTISSSERPSPCHCAMVWRGSDPNHRCGLRSCWMSIRAASITRSSRVGSLGLS